MTWELEYKLNLLLNKAMCSPDRIKNPNSNNIAKFIMDNPIVLTGEEFLCTEREHHFDLEKCTEQCANCRQLIEYQNMHTNRTT